jgi:hypothetical protein
MGKDIRNIAEQFGRRNNDWNFMMTLSPSFLYEQVKLHFKEILQRY